MGHWLRRLNDLAIFNASRWPKREFLARFLGTLGVAIFMARRLLLFPSFPGLTRDVYWVQELLAKLPAKWTVAPINVEFYYTYYGYSLSQIRLIWWIWFLIWSFESAILIGYVVAWLTRTRAQSVARGFLETVFPMMLAGLPFLISMTGYTFLKWMPAERHAHLATLITVFSLPLIGGAINLIGLLTLRRAFSIMSEARMLIRRGIYRWVRHPLYAGHFIIFLGYTLLHFHWYTVAMYVALVSGQIVRARIEERKLAAVFPKYEEYRQITGMFFPRLF